MNVFDFLRNAYFAKYIEVNIFRQICLCEIFTTEDIACYKSYCMTAKLCPLQTAPQSFQNKE